MLDVILLFLCELILWIWIYDLPNFENAYLVKIIVQQRLQIVGFLSPYFKYLWVLKCWEDDELLWFYVFVLSRYILSEVFVHEFLLLISCLGHLHNPKCRILFFFPFKYMIFSFTKTANIRRIDVNCALLVFKIVIHLELMLDMCNVCKLVHLMNHYEVFFFEITIRGVSWYLKSML